MRYDDRTQELLNVINEKKDMQLEDSRLNLLKGIIEFRDFTLTNIRLIKYQNAKANVVHQYETWQKIGYPVRKRNSAIRILMPQPFRKNNKIIPQLRYINVFSDESTYFDNFEKINLKMTEEEIINYTEEVCKNLDREYINAILLLKLLLKLSSNIQLEKREIEKLYTIDEELFLSELSQLRFVFYKELNDLKELEEETSNNLLHEILSEDELVEETKKNIQVIESVKKGQEIIPTCTTADRQMKLKVKLEYASKRAEKRNESTKKIGGLL